MFNHKNNYKSFSYSIICMVFVIYCTTMAFIYKQNLFEKAV